MEKITVREILEAAKGSLVAGNKNAFFDNICTDTRSIKKGDLFIALQGKNFDGNNFIDEAIKRGAKGVIIRRPSSVFRGEKEINIIKVDDTLKALGDIGNLYQKKFKIKMIAITGSNGKTTTKEMLSSILSQKYRVLKNKGNFNNQIGTPLTLFRLSKKDRFVVLELGTNYPGEIKRLSEIVMPDVGILTNIGLSHTEGLGSLNGVAKEKISLFLNLRTGGVAIFNSDDKKIREYLKKILPVLKKKKIKPIAYGIKNKSGFYASEIKNFGEKGLSFILNTGKSKINIHIGFVGIHNVYNALAAAACAFTTTKINLAGIKKGLEKTPVSPMRSEIIKTGKSIIINDAYNANPNSLEKALLMVKNWDTGKKGFSKKIVVLGDMLELGKFTKKAHKDAGLACRKCGIDILAVYGSLAELAAKEFKKDGGATFVFKDKDKLKKFIVRESKENNLILVKGSRAMRMEETIKGI